MDDDTVSTTFFPSMQPKAPERVVRTEQGEAMIPFKMDDEAAALSRLADAQEEKARQQHRQEIENIRRHGPLNRLTERVVAEGEEESMRAAPGLRLQRMSSSCAALPMRVTSTAWPSASRETSKSWAQRTTTLRWSITLRTSSIRPMTLPGSAGPSKWPSGAGRRREDKARSKYDRPPSERGTCYYY